MTSLSTVMPWYCRMGHQPTRAVALSRCPSVPLLIPCHNTCPTRVRRRYHVPLLWARGKRWCMRRGLVRGPRALAVRVVLQRLIRLRLIPPSWAANIFRGFSQYQAAVSDRWARLANQARRTKRGGMSACTCHALRRPTDAAKPWEWPGTTLGSPIVCTAWTTRSRRCNFASRTS